MPCPCEDPETADEIEVKMTAKKTKAKAADTAVQSGSDDMGAIGHMLAALKIIEAEQAASDDVEKEKEYRAVRAKLGTLIEYTKHRLY